MSNKSLFSVIATTFLLVIAPGAARADFTLTLTGGSDTVVIDAAANNTFTVTSDNIGIASGTQLMVGGTYGSSGQLSIASGGYLNSNGQTQMAISGLSFDGYSTYITGASSNFPGGPTLGYLSLTNFIISGSSTEASSLGISVSESGFTAPAGPRSLEAAFDQITLPGSAVITRTTSYSDGDGNNYTFTNSGGPGSTQTGPTFNSNSPYTITDSVTITGLSSTLPLTNGGVTMDVNYPTPAPSGLVLILSAFPLLGMLLYRGRWTPAPL